MQELKYINKRGQEINFTSYAPYVFWQIDGLGIPEIEPIFNQAPNQHGYSLTNMLLNERTVTISAHLHGKDLSKMYELRRNFAKVLNPIMGLGKLVYKNDYGVFEIGAFLKNYSNLDKYDNIGLQTIELEFECPFPFFTDIEEKGIILNYVEGGLEFPLKTPNEFGLFGYFVDADIKTDYPAPIEMLVDGGANIPVISNITTGEFIKIEKFIEPHEKLYINTDPQNIEVSIIRTDPQTNEAVKENAYGYLSYDSTLFRLIDGLNSLSFSSDDEENKKVRVKIFYKQYQLGV